MELREIPRAADGPLNQMCQSIEVHLEIRREITPYSEFCTPIVSM